MSIDELKEELREADSAVSQRIKDLEAEYTTWHLGIPIPLGSEFTFEKVNHKWRFCCAEDGTPVTDTPRNERAEFLLVWGDRKNFEVAVEKALRAAIAERKSIL